MRIAFGGLPMNPDIRRLRIDTLKAQMELCRVTLGALESESIQQGLTPDQRLKFFWRWDAVMRDSEAAKDNLAVLELEE